MRPAFHAPSRSREYLACLSLILVGTGLRLYRLDSTALWWDEGLSLLFARLDYVANARMAVQIADSNPPFYRLLLGLWLALVGWSPFTARFFSVLAGVVVLAVVYRLARELRLSAAAAVLTTALCAASPMLVYASQEAKAYSLVVLAGAGSILLWLRLHRHLLRPAAAYLAPARRLTWLLWGAAVLLAVGSHYIAVFLIGLENLWSAGLTLVGARGRAQVWTRQWRRLLAVQAAAAAFLLPFAALTFRGTQAIVQGETGEFHGLNSLGTFFGAHALELAAGPSGKVAWGWLATALLGLCVLVGWRATRKHAALASWVTVPLLLGLALNTYHEFFSPRFLAYVVPGLMLLVAEGMVRFSRGAASAFRGVHSVAWATVACGLCWALWSPSLRAYYDRSSDALDDWRPAASALWPLLRPGDVAVYGYGWIPGYLDAYLPHAPRPTYVLGHFTREGVNDELRAITTAATRIWLLDSHVDQFNPANLAGTWLGGNAALVYDQWLGHAHLALFALAPTPNRAEGTVTVDFRSGLRLIAPMADLVAAPGDALALRLEWQAVRRVARPMTVYLHGLAPDGSLAFGRDSEPDNGLARVTNWQAGTSHIELRGVLIPPDLPPGTYTVQVGLYETLNGDADGQPPARLGTVTVK